MENDKAVFAVARCGICSTDIFSVILLMSTCWFAQIIILLILLLPSTIVGMFAIWYTYAQRHGFLNDWLSDKSDTTRPEWNEEWAHYIKTFELVVFTAVFIVRVAPKIMHLFSTTRLLFRFTHLSRWMKSGRCRLLTNGVLAFVMSQIVLMPCTWALSWFTQIQAHVGQLLVPLHVLFLTEYISSAGPPMVQEFMRLWLPNSILQITIYDVRRLQCRSIMNNTTDVQDALNKTSSQTSATELLKMITSVKVGLGRMNDTTCRIRIELISRDPFSMQRQVKIPMLIV